MTSSRIPVLLLTGFLGSGKTTLLNHLMRARPPTPGKLAIVVNEFGDVGIDGDLLPSSMTRQVELPGGCICCVLNEELDTTLVELLRDNPEVETVVIETTGVAEPLPISWSLGREPLVDRVRLAAVITVVDAVNFPGHRPLSPAVDAQVEYADLLVVSKLDLVAETTGRAEMPVELADMLDELNGDALRIWGTAEDVVNTLWQTIVDPERPLRSSPPHESGTGDGVHPHDSARHGRAHGPAHGFETIWMPIDKTIDFEELSDQLEELPANYVRIKGIAHAVDGSTGSTAPRWVAFHRVGTRVSCEPLDNPGESRVVALGTGLQPAVLAACIEAAVIPST